MIIQEASDITGLLAAFVLLVTLDFPFFVLNVNIYYLFSENFFLSFLSFYLSLSLSHLTHLRMQTDTSIETHTSAQNPFTARAKNFFINL